VRELALHILDLLQNAVEAGATRVTLHVDEDRDRDMLSITAMDNGRGMDSKTIEQALDPFYTTRKTRHVGLGLPLMAAAAERAGGTLSIRSQPGAGTTVEASFRLSHPDRQPMGDLAATLLAFLLSEKEPGLNFRHRMGDQAFEFDTDGLQAALEDLPLSHPAVQRWLAEYLTEGEALLAAG
jgi:anti-sigma regulatory factor (Ser/Thr protein kinase)